LKVLYKGFKNPWLLTKRLQKEPIILMGHDLFMLVDVQGQ
jgi:hypothetical protein